MKVPMKNCVWSVRSPQDSIDPQNFNFNQNIRLTIELCASAWNKTVVAPSVFAKLRALAQKKSDEELRMLSALPQ